MVERHYPLATARRTLEKVEHSEWRRLLYAPRKKPYHRERWSGRRITEVVEAG